MRTLPDTSWNHLSLSVLLALGAGGSLRAQHAARGEGRAESPVELGAVAWEHDFDAGFARAKALDRPLFLLFQEIPGCSTCVDFGNGPLSQPLLVEAIETEFVPVVVYNNEPGRPAQLLAKFGEPSWNNPVLRFFAPHGAELLERKDRIWTTGGVAGRMAAALEAAGREVPHYLRLVLEETVETNTETAVFAVHCYWEGEAKLGGLDGVLATESAWVEQNEVVRLVFDPARISYSELLASALSMDCASTAYTTSDAQLAAARQAAAAARPRPSALRRAKEADQLYYLRNSVYAGLRLSPLQRVKVNAALGTSGDPRAWLSPRQKESAATLLLAERAEPAASPGAEPGAEG